MWVGEGVIQGPLCIDPLLMIFNSFSIVPILLLVKLLTSRSIKITSLVLSIDILQVFEVLHLTCIHSVEVFLVEPLHLINENGFSSYLRIN